MLLRLTCMLYVKCCQAFITRPTKNRKIPKYTEELFPFSCYSHLSSIIYELAQLRVSKTTIDKTYDLHMLGLQRASKMYILLLIYATGRFQQLCHP